MEVAQRPVTLPMTSGRVPLKPLNLEGTVHVEGNMTHFVTEDLEYKIKLSSPVTKKGDTPPLPGNSKTGKDPILIQWEEFQIHLERFL